MIPSLKRQGSIFSANNRCFLNVIPANAGIQQSTEYFFATDICFNLGLLNVSYFIKIDHLLGLRVREDDGTRVLVLNLYLLSLLY
jgi:hypothetical protein